MTNETVSSPVRLSPLKAAAFYLELEAPPCVQPRLLHSLLRPSQVEWLDPR